MEPTYLPLFQGEGREGLINKHMKHFLTIIAVTFTTAAITAQNINPQQQQPLPQVNVYQNNPPPVQQVLNFNPLNNENNNDNVDRNINVQVQQVNKVDDDNEQQGNNFNNVKQEKEKEPCPDCDKIKKAKRENYGNNVAGNYNGGAQKFKRRKNWKRFCYNISHRTGNKKGKSNYSMCFNW